MPCEKGEIFAQNTLRHHPCPFKARSGSLERATSTGGAKVRNGVLLTAAGTGEDLSAIIPSDGETTPFTGQESPALSTYYGAGIPLPVQDPDHGPLLLHYFPGPAQSRVAYVQGFIHSGDDNSPGVSKRYENILPRSTGSRPGSSLQETPRRGDAPSVDQACAPQAGPRTRNAPEIEIGEPFRVVGRVTLVFDDHKVHRRERSKDRSRGPDHYPGLSRPHPLPSLPCGNTGT